MFFWFWLFGGGGYMPAVRPSLIISLLFLVFLFAISRDFAQFLHILVVIATLWLLSKIVKALT